MKNLNLRRFLLSSMFYLVFAPMSLVIKLFRIDLLERKIDKDKETYWKNKEKRPEALLVYERQF